MKQDSPAIELLVSSFQVTLFLFLSLVLVYMLFTLASEGFGKHID